MKVLVTGSRGWKDMAKVRDRLLEFPGSTTIVHGGARGADKIAHEVALFWGFDVVPYPAKNYPNPLKRNIAMLDEEKPDLVLAFWDGASTGTAHTMSEARKRGIPVEIIR